MTFKSLIGAFKIPCTMYTQQDRLLSQPMFVSELLLFTSFTDRHSGASDEAKKAEELLFKEVCDFTLLRRGKQSSKGKLGGGGDSSLAP